MNDWSDETIMILDKIRLNSILLNKYYKKQHLELHAKIKYFKIPLIVLNGVSATASVGLSTYGFSQNLISGIVCVIGLTNGIITSVEMFLGIEKSAEKSIILSKEFYVLSCDIYKTIHLNPHERGVEASVFMSDCYSRYIELVRQNGVMDKSLNDQMMDLDSLKPPIQMRIPITPKSMSSASYDSMGDLENQVDTIKGMEINTVDKQEGVEMV